MVGLILSGAGLYQYPWGTVITFFIIFVGIQISSFFQILSCGGAALTFSGQTDKSENISGKREKSDKAKSDKAKSETELSS